jgi:putative PIN family toxin of toxin-antitoxin system
VSAASAPDDDSGCYRHQRFGFSIVDSGGLPEAVIKLAVSGQVQWFASESVLAEYEEVLKRPRLAIDSGKASDAMARILATVSVVSAAVRVAAASDPDDNRFLECAEAAQAHYLVTGNIRHFPEVWKETRIVTPREFIDAWTTVPDDLL